MTIIKRDPRGETLSIDPCSSIIRVDKINVCKRVMRGGVVWLQFKDKDRMRSGDRGTAFVEVPLEAFKLALLKEGELNWPYPA